MTTKLDSPLRREITVEGHPYTVVLTPAAVRITPKGGRKGIELAWKDLLSGEKALAVALNASLANLPPAEEKRREGKVKTVTRRVGRK